MDKTEARRTYRKLRDAFLSQHHDSAQESLNQNLIQFLSTHSGIWGAYCAYGSEADPRAAIRSTAGRLTWCYPRVQGSHMSFFIPLSETAWSVNQWGIQEPDLKVSTPVPVSDIQGLMIPGVAFDQLGTRLGSGKGFYDRVLCDFGGLKVGVGFSCQIASGALPKEDHDILMDFVVTEHSVISVKGQPVWTH